MVVAAAVRAASHRDDVARVWHLVVHTARGRRHLVGDSSGNEDDVSLARRRSERDAEAVHVVARSSEVHHLDGAARQAERQRPQ